MKKVLSVALVCMFFLTSLSNSKVAYAADSRLGQPSCINYQEAQIYYTFDSNNGYMEAGNTYILGDGYSDYWILANGNAQYCLDARLEQGVPFKVEAYVYALDGTHLNTYSENNFDSTYDEFRAIVIPRQGQPVQVYFYITVYADTQLYSYERMNHTIIFGY